MKVTGLILFVGLIIHALFDPLAILRNQIERNKLQKELTTAKAIWDSQNITDYSYEMIYWIPLWGECGAKIMVRQGKIIEVVEQRHGGIDLEFPEPVILDKEDWDKDFCHYSNFTIPEVFEAVQGKVNIKITIGAAFDPENGFVTWYYGNQNVNHGILHTFVTESEFSYRFNNFQNLDPSIP